MVSAWIDPSTVRTESLTCACTDGRLQLDAQSADGGEAQRHQHLQHVVDGRGRSIGRGARRVLDVPAGGAQPGRVRGERRGHRNGPLRKDGMDGPAVFVGC